MCRVITCWEVDRFPDRQLRQHLTISLGPRLVGSEKYAPDQKHQRLVEFLFPELLPLPVWPDEARTA